MSIIGSLPYILQDGTVADANQVMADLNFIKSAVNANATPLSATGAFSIATVAALRALAPPTVSAVYTLLGYNSIGDNGGGQLLSVYGAAVGSYVDDGVTIFVPTGGNGSSAFIRLFTGIIDARQAGCLCNGQDDSTAWGRLLAVANNRSIYLPANSLVASTQSVNSMTNALFFGPGQITLSGNYTAISIGAPTNVTWSIGFSGPLNNQQYALAVNGATIAGSFPSSGFTLQNLTNTTASSFGGNTTVTKSGTTVTVKLTSDAGLNMPNGVGVIGSAITITPATRYVVFGVASPSGIGTAAPRFIELGGTEYIPGGNLGGSNYDYMTGIASFQVKVGTGRGTNTTTLSSVSGYTGAAYNMANLQLYSLVNDFASTNWASVSFPGALEFSGGSNVRVTGALFNNLWSACVFIGTAGASFVNNTVNQCLAGVNLTATNGSPITDATISLNRFDCTFLDESGLSRPNIVSRQKPIGGSLGYGSANVSVSGNVIKGACWAMEFVNPSTPVQVQNLSITENNIDFGNLGISTNCTQNLICENNVITSNYAFANQGIEVADNNSVASTVTGNEVYLNQPYAQTSVGIGIGGQDAKIIANTISAAVGLASVNTGVAQWAIKSNTIRCGNTGILLRNVAGDLSEQNNIRYYGYSVDGLNYAPNNMTALYCDDTIGTANLNVMIADNTLESGPNGIGILNRQQLQVVNNRLYNPGGFNPPYPFIGTLSNSFAAATAVQYFFEENKWICPGFSFSNNAFVFVNLPASGSGTAIVSRNYTYASAGAGSTVGNSYTFTGQTVAVVT